MLETQLYTEQVKMWPQTGRHILAHYDDRSVIVYQAYRPAIGRYAAEQGRFGGEFSYSRMSWVKPNFLWGARDRSAGELSDRDSCSREGAGPGR